MADDRAIEQLDRAVERLLAGEGAAEVERLLAGEGAAAVEPGVAPLVEVAARLRGLPREDFRERLREELKRRTTMTTTTTADYRRAGFADVTPAFVVPGSARFLDFLKRAFGGEEVLRIPGPEGGVMHAEVRIGDSLVELGDPSANFAAKTTAIHLYVPDVDAAYRRAVEAGAESLYEPVDQPYGDREAGIRDGFGNEWFLATHQGESYRPEGLRDVTTGFRVHGADRMIAFLREVFGAGEGEVHRSPEGVVVHAKIPIGDSLLELSEAHGPWQPMSPSTHVYVEDADAVYGRALAAGATVLTPMRTAAHGDRGGAVTDPFGNTWYIATYVGVR